MARKKWSLNVNILVIIIGVLTILLGTYIVSSTHVYTLVLFGKRIEVAQRSFSFLTIFDGFFLIVFGYLLTGKTRTSFRIINISLIITFLLFVISITRHNHVTILGAALTAFALYSLYRRRKDYHFPSRTLGRPEVAVALITIVFTVSYGVGGSLLLGEQFSPPITSVGNAIYYTGETVTTLGFGDILPITLTSRIFTISLSILGVAIFFGAMTILITPIIERRIGGIVTRMEKRQLESLEDYTLILGYSEYLHKYLASLLERGEVVVVVEEDSRTSEKLKEEGYIVLNQKADDENLLRSFNLNKARRIIISSNDDGYNLLISSSIRQIEDAGNRKLHDMVVVVAASSSNINKFSIFEYRVVDVSSVVSDYLFSSLGSGERNPQ